ncbi:MAG: zinc dependent phospholipase C family protein, partial [Desulfomonilia bacterium]|nr:zinc dependent phospholipase C family protein [Desulfomonilia bacterium]
MPKENTHLFFSHGLLEDLPGDELLRELSLNIDAYYLGAVLPDSFYYSADNSVASISAFIHGKDGNPTNTLIFEVLDQEPRGADLALILGFITHCALDIVFHPVIYYLSGNYYDPDPKNRSRATYWHRHLETGLDIALDNTLRMPALVRPRVLKGLIFERLVSRHFKVTGSRIRGTIRKQVLLNRVFESRRVYRLARLLLRREFILTDPTLLGLF